MDAQATPNRETVPPDELLELARRLLESDASALPTAAALLAIEALTQHTADRHQLRLVYPPG